MTTKTREEKAREAAEKVLADFGCCTGADDILLPLIQSILKAEDEAVKEWAFWSKRLLSDLPSKRDWLDPDIERNLKSLIEKYSTERKEL